MLCLHRVRCNSILRFNMFMYVYGYCSSKKERVKFEYPLLTQTLLIIIMCEKDVCSGKEIMNLFHITILTIINQIDQ